MMKKKIAITLFVTALLSLAGTVEAGDSRHGYKNSHHRGHTPTNYRNKHYRKHHGYGHYRGGYGPAHHRHKHHSHHLLRDGLRFAAGALIVGSVIHAISDSQPRVIYRSSTDGSHQNHWYRIAQDGQCVEVRLNQNGEEVWTPAEPYRCR